MFYCVFVRVSHSNQEESTSLQKKGLESPWLASIQGADANSALETVPSAQVSSICLHSHLSITN